MDCAFGPGVRGHSKCIIKGPCSWEKGSKDSVYCSVNCVLGKADWKGAEA